MSCNHLDDCLRCDGLVDLEQEVNYLEVKIGRLKGIKEVILGSIRQEASLQSCNGTGLSLLIGEMLNRIADNIEDCDEGKIL